MLLLELLVILILVAFAANGFRGGAIETLGRLVGAILGFLAAKMWSGWLIVALSLFMPITWASLVAFLLVFLVVDSLVGFFFKLGDQIFKVLTKLPLIKQASEAIGAVIGFLEGIVVIGGTAYLLHQVAASSVPVQSVISLKTIAFIELVFTKLLAFLL